MRLAELAGLAAGTDRFPPERDLFRLIKSLRERNSNETRLAFLALAQRHQSRPAARAGGLGLLGRGVRDPGDTETGRNPRAAAPRSAPTNWDCPRRPPAFAFVAAASSFRRASIAEADALLSRVADDPRAGGVRAKAGMLRGLARGRALAAGAPGMTPAAYAEALDRQIRDFPKDPATDEARWLLGTAPRGLRRARQGRGPLGRDRPRLAPLARRRLARGRAEASIALSPCSPRATAICSRRVSACPVSSRTRA